MFENKFKLLNSQDSNGLYDDFYFSISQLNNDLMISFNILKSNFLHLIYLKFYENHDSQQLNTECEDEEEKEKFKKGSHAVKSIQFIKNSKKKQSNNRKSDRIEEMKKKKVEKHKEIITG